MSIQLVAVNMGFSGVSIGETGLLLRCEVKVRILLESKQGNWPSSRDKGGGNMGILSSCAGILGFLLSYGRYLGEPLELHKGSQASFRISRGNSDCSQVTSGEKGVISH